ncbi:MAG: SEC-C metal-binding domain-containing protein, partial [Planctomycetota bacterium]|nr:SEC-C metal-binding domain-containing protein [Planctomycetota bacterium]
RLHDARGEVYGEDWEGVQRFLILETIDNKWKDHLYAMDILKQGVSLRSYAQVDPKNEYKKEGFEKFQALKTEIADHICGFIYKREATDTIRDLVTGKIQPQRPQQAPPQVPQTPEELQALFESLIAAGKVPQEILDRMEAGEKFQLRATPQGLALAPAEGSEDSSAPSTGEGPGAAGQPPKPTPQQRLAPARPAPPTQPKQPPKPPAPSRPAGMPKPGRNDPCPCGSGIKYKKCCAPAFD